MYKAHSFFSFLRWIPSFCNHFPRNELEGVRAHNYCGALAYPFHSSPVPSDATSPQMVDRRGRSLLDEGGEFRTPRLPH